LTSRTTLLRRTAASITAAGVALAGAAVLTATPSQAATKKLETPFAYQGSAYGTRVTAGDPNQGGVASGRTAWSVLGCTAMAPIRNDRGSNVGKVNANDLIKVGAVDSYTSSYRRPTKKVFGSRSVNKVADIVLGADDGPQLRFAGLTTVAHAYNDKGTFRASADINLLGVEAEGIVPDGSETPGPLSDLLDAVDEADDQLVEAVIEGAGTNGIDIPGLGTIYPAGTHKTPTSRKGATANAFGIRVILENGSRVDIGRAWARIQTAYPAGVFAGHAYGYEAVVGEGVAGLGRTPYQNLPCIGTKGEWRTNPLVEAPRNAQLDASALKAQTYGKPFRDGRAIARARASVTEVSLGGGALELQGVVGQVNVFQDKRGRITGRTTEGTRIGAIIANGEAQEIPAPGETLEIPGVARIRAGLRQNLGKRGLRVHALRVELLDGTGLVLNIGTAKAKILR
jgi:hypothetical protein